MRSHFPAQLAPVAFAGLALAASAAARAQSPVVADGSAVGLTRFEMQRGLLQIDEQRRRLETSLEPVDSVLRVLAADTLKIASIKRAPVVDQDAVRLASIARELRMYPSDRDLITSFVDAVTRTTRDFSMADNTLRARMLLKPAAQDVLERSPNAVVVALNDELPPFNTPLWDKVRQSDYGKRQLARVTLKDVNGFIAAISDAGFARYRSTLLAATKNRMAEIRQTRDATRGEIQRLGHRAADLANIIGAQEDTGPDSRVITVGIPTFAIILLALLLVPRAYRSLELHRPFLSS